MFLEVALERSGLLRSALQAGLGHGRDLIDDHALALGVRVRLVPPGGEHGVQRPRRAGGQVVVDAHDAVALPVLAGDVGGHVHHVEDRDGLEQSNLCFGLGRNDESAVHAADGAVVGGLRRGDHGADIAADQLRGHLLQGDVAGKREVEVSGGGDDGEGTEAGGGVDKLVCCAPESFRSFGCERGELDEIPQHLKVDAAGDDAVLDVVDAVGDVVGAVHHLRLHRRVVVGVAFAQPGENVCVLVVRTVFAVDGPVGCRAGARVFARGVERGAGEVKAKR